MTEFTKGKWVADSTYVRTAINVKATANSPHRHIALVNIDDDPEYEITLEEHEANARLIAAAPDLYHALMMVLDDPEALDGRPRTYEVVIESLAKARGER